MNVIEKNFNRLLIGLSCLRLGMMTLLVLGIPRLLVKDGWYFHHGGDQGLMFDAALSILQGQPKYTYVGAGMPLVMALLIRVFHAGNYLGIIVPLVLINGFLLGSLSIILLGVLGRRLTGRHDVALLAAAVWTALPYLFYAVVGVHRDAELFRDSYLPFLLWANGLSEGPSQFLYLLGLLLVLVGVEGTRVSSHTSRFTFHAPRFALSFVAAGLVFGLAGVIRIHTLASIAIVLGLLLLKREWRGLAALIPGLVVGYWPQFWYSHGYSGSAFNIPYVQNWFRVDASGSLLIDLKNTPFAPQFLFANTVGLGLRHPEIALPGLAALALGLLGLVHFWRRRGWFKALLLFGSPAFTWLFHAFTFVFSADPFRFSVPAFPLLTVAGAYTLFASGDWVRARCARAKRPIGQRVTVVDVRKAPEQG